MRRWLDEVEKGSRELLTWQSGRKRIFEVSKAYHVVSSTRVPPQASPAGAAQNGQGVSKFALLVGILSHMWQAVNGPCRGSTANRWQKENDLFKDKEQERERFVFLFIDAWEVMKRLSNVLQNAWIRRYLSVVVMLSWGKWKKRTPLLKSGGSGFIRVSTPELKRGLQNAG